MCNKLFHKDDGIINKISTKDSANARYHEYQNHWDVGKNHHKNINTINVWNELKKYANQYLQFHFNRFLIKFLSISILKGNKSFVLTCISRFCHIELATTENTTKQKATIIDGVVVVEEKSIFLNIKYTAGNNTANCENLAIIKDQLNLFIFQNNCNGSCCIHTNILLAEYNIARGNAQIINWLSVYAGIK